MKQIIFRGFLFASIFLLYGMANAQQTVTGTVTDETGPLPGATVAIKGTSTGTTTDFDGNYTLNNVPADATLVYSFVGYETQEVLLEGRSIIDINLAADASELEEVVLIGYGQTTVRDATGAVSSVKSDEFNKGINTSPDQLLQGRVAGVQITQASGEPGAGANIRVRGTSSIRAGNDPLIVVDGVPLSGGNVSPGNDTGLGRRGSTNPLAFINSSDIASIDILKDASATAIYGSRGANGVVLITTRGGRSGKPQISFNSSFQTSKISNEYDLISAEDYPGIASSVGNSNSDFGARVDPLGSILRTAFTQQHDFSYGSGGDTGNFRISLGLLDQEGIVKGTGQEKYTGNINIT